MSDVNRVSVDEEALAALVDAINDVHDTHPHPHNPEVVRLLELKRKVWDSKRSLYKRSV